eukprot:scaffold961_cov122-Cylindrotheca_fusiformis.AAC.31
MKLEPKSSDLGLEETNAGEVDSDAARGVEAIERVSPELPLSTHVAARRSSDASMETDLTALLDALLSSPDRQETGHDDLSPSSASRTERERKDSIIASADKGLRTPPRPKHVRRRIDGSPILPLCKMPSKTIYLLRHGFSRGQAAQNSGLDRKNDKSLRDCGLTEQGIQEARAIPNQFSVEEMSKIQIVFSSPFTRALHTALLGFPSKKIVCHFDLGEIGSKAPENTPRKMTAVMSDILGAIEERDDSCNIDVTTYQPPNWPRDSVPGVIKKEKVRKFFHWLYQARSETTIAVVCHHNVIKTALIGGEKMRPKNAEVIRCTLNSNGELLETPKTADTNR